VPANDPTGRRFGEAAAAYERGRPGYPSAMVDWLLEDAPCRVVDLGAGTGKLTRLVADRVETVVAVEPDAGMRQVLAELLPGTSVLDGTAEDIPLPDGFADAVVVGQAWHWVDPVRGVPEVARVLRPGGTLGLIWNDRDASDPWISALSVLLEEYGTSPDAGYEPLVGAPFGPLETAELSWTNEVLVATVVDISTSRSYVIALSPTRRAGLVDRLRDLADEARDPLTGLVPVRYVTRGYRARRPETDWAGVSAHPTRR
jgi:SAM-dependent methyltransferase